MTPSCSSWPWRGSRRRTGTQFHQDHHYLQIFTHTRQHNCDNIYFFYIINLFFFVIQREVSSEPESEGGTWAHRAGVRQSSRGLVQDQASPPHPESFQRGRDQKNCKYFLNNVSSKLTVCKHQLKFKGKEMVEKMFL